jgi:hypothetical protein
MDKAMESRKRSQLISMTLSAKLTDHRKLGKQARPAEPLCATLLSKKQAAKTDFGEDIRAGMKKGARGLLCLGLGSRQRPP